VAGSARYDGIADWYDATFVESEIGRATRETVLALLGRGPGTLLDVGCGTGGHTAVFKEFGWTVTGVDVSEDQLRLARERGLDVKRADASALSFADASFDAAVSIFTHTDVDNFAAVTREIARVLRPGAPFAYTGVHPCFVGPHSRFIAAEGVPTLHSGYRETARYNEAVGISPEGLRAKVGGIHLPLGLFLQAFLDTGFILERFEEPGREYPYQLAMRWRR
jgi:SAM-dependent methyltransferase